MIVVRRRRHPGFGVVGEPEIEEDRCPDPCQIRARAREQRVDDGLPGIPVAPQVQGASVHRVQVDGYSRSVSGGKNRPPGLSWVRGSGRTRAAIVVVVSSTDQIIRSGFLDRRTRTFLSAMTTRARYGSGLRLRLRLHLRLRLLAIKGTGFNRILRLAEGSENLEMMMMMIMMIRIAGKIHRMLRRCFAGDSFVIPDEVLDEVQGTVEAQDRRFEVSVVVEIDPRVVLLNGEMKETIYPLVHRRPRPFPRNTAVRRIHVG